jgi:hypothetical protein
MHLREYLKVSSLLLLTLVLSSCSSWPQLFKKKFEEENGDPLVAYVLSVRDYETLALNIAEIKRYIEQQKEIIVYYEEAVKPRKKDEVKK